MPSRQVEDDVEGFGITFLEAGARCLPVIGTSHGGIPEAIVDGETGYLVRPEDEKSLVEYIVYLLSNPDQCKILGQRGHERSLQFDWTNSVKRIDALLIQIQGERMSPVKKAEQ